MAVPENVKSWTAGAINNFVTTGTYHVRYQLTHLLRLENMNNQDKATNRDSESVEAKTTDRLYAYVSQNEPVARADCYYDSNPMPPLMIFASFSDAVVA
jgi:hypothetical protein